MTMRLLILATALIISLPTTLMASANQCIDVYISSAYVSSSKNLIQKPLTKTSLAITSIKNGAVFYRGWSLAKVGFKEFFPTGDTRFLAPYRRLRGDYNLPSIGLDLTYQTVDGLHKISVYAMSGHEATLYKMAAVLEQLPPAFLKTLETIELWPTSEAGDFTMLGHGFLLQDPQPGSFMGETIKMFGGVLRTYGQSQPIITMKGLRSDDKLELKISSDLIKRIGMPKKEREALAAQEASQVKFHHEDGYLHDHIRRVEAMRNEVSHSILGNRAIAELLSSMVNHAFYELTEAQQNDYVDAIRKDGRGLPFSSQYSKDWSWDNIRADFSSALISISKLSYTEKYFEENFPHRLAYMKKLFGY